MPFVTSEIYGELVAYNEKELMVSKWPTYKEALNYPEEEKMVEQMKQIIVEIRNIRASKNIHPAKKAKLIFVTEKYQKEIEEAKNFLLKLGFGSQLMIQKGQTEIAEDAIQILTEGMTVYMPLEGLIDKEEERKRQAQEKQRLERRNNKMRKNAIESRVYEESSTS